MLGDTMPTEVYANAFIAHLGAYDALFEFVLESPSSSDASQSEQHRVARVRVSLEQAWVMARLLNKIVEQRIGQSGPLSIPEEVIARLGLDKDYQEMWKGRS
jgi:hypothetical protein